MNSEVAAPVIWKYPPSLRGGFVLYVGYLAVFFTTWWINGVDYPYLGANAETMRLWYAYPTLLGCAFLVVGLSVLGWWRIALFNTTKSGPAWGWILPVTMAASILSNVLNIQTEYLSYEMVLWATLGAVGVGFGEEMITRGSMIVGLRSRLREGHVWLISTLLFSALHVPNVMFGLPVQFMPIQVAFTFVIGTAFYVIRRLTGSLFLSMFLHGAWDSAMFLCLATGGEPTDIHFAVYPMTLICAIAMSRGNTKGATA